MANVKLTANFFFKQGKFAKVEWVEVNPRVVQKDKESEKIVREIPLTPDEVRSEYLRLFLTSKNKGEAIILTDVSGVGHLIDLADVRNVEIVAGEQPEEVKDTETSVAEGEVH